MKIRKLKLILEEGEFRVYDINNHPNGACYLLERKDKKETCKGVIGEYFWLMDKLKRRLEELIKRTNEVQER